jgi:hypothetical protein
VGPGEGRGREEEERQVGVIIELCTSCIQVLLPEPEPEQLPTTSEVGAGVRVSRCNKSRGVMHAFI